MDSLVTSPFSEISATLELLGNLGVTPQIFKAMRADKNLAQRIANQMLAGAPDYRIHTIATKIDREKFPSLISRRDFPESIIWDPTRIKIVVGAEEKSAENLEGLFHFPYPVLEYILENQELIPAEWYQIKGPLFFLGTEVFKGDAYPYEVYGIEKSSNSKNGLWGLTSDKLKVFSKHPSHTRKCVMYRI